MPSTSHRRLRIASRTLLALLAAAIGACGSGVRHLRVVQVTDVHGNYSTPPDRDGQPQPGGLRRLAAYVDVLRDDDDLEVLLVDSGDMWSGTLLADRYEGAPGVAAYDALGFDAAALGNHEFDYGPVGPSRVGEDPFSALKARLAEAKFPVLAANLRDKATGELPDWPNLKPSVLIERGGFKIGLIGVITPSTPEITFPYVGQALRFDAPAGVIVEEATRLRHRGAELVFVLAHLGGRCDRLDNPTDRSSCQPDTELFELARELPPGTVDAIFGGHTHAQVAHELNGIPLLQAGAGATHAAILDVFQPEEQPRIVKISPPRPLLDEASTASVKAVDAVLAPLEQEVARIRAEDLGARLVEGVTRARDRSSTLGALVCEALLAEHPSRSICLVNSGGLRADIDAGPVTYGEVYDALPFGNAVAYLDLPGKTLIEMLRLGTVGVHGVPQLTGARLTYDLGRDRCPTVDRDGDGRIDAYDRQRLVSATLDDGTPIDPEAEYRVVTNSFVASGGDGYGHALRKVHPNRVRVLHDALPVREVVAAWMRRHRPLLNSPDKPLMRRPTVVPVGVADQRPCER